MSGQPHPADFWSRRRAAVQAEAEAEAAAALAAETEAERETREEVAAERSDAEILADLGLPDPDTMEQGDDFAAFLKSAVPERIRRRALRRLWRSNPVLANLDGLVDHGEDFSDAATVMPGMQTAYQVGRGMMRHVMALAEAEADTAEDGVAPEVPLDDEAAVPEPALSVEATPRQEAALAEDDTAPAPRGHMRFTFSETERETAL